MTRWLAPALLAVGLIAAPVAAQQPAAPAAPKPAAAAPKPGAPAKPGTGAKPAAPTPAEQAPAPEAPPAGEDQGGDEGATPGPVDENAPLPAGHPPIEGGGSRAGMPNVPQDSAQPAPMLPAGTVEVRVVDPEGNPLPRTPVKLGIVRQSVAEGEQRDFKLETSDEQGKSRFSGLQIGSKYQYRATVESEGAVYASDPFSMRADFGMDVLLHVFPVSTDINRTMLASQGIVVVSPREDTFQFEVLFRFFNVGKTTWLPRDVVLDMPAGFKAFSAEEGMSDTRVVAEGEQSVRLAGTFSPGQHEVTFRFQVPNDHDPDVGFRMALPPHMGEVRVIAEAAKGMGMQVEGFGAAESTTGQDGRRLLVTSRRMRQGDVEIPELMIRLSGIPTPGPGRWYAVVIAALLAAAGFSIAMQDRKEKSAQPTANTKDAKNARDILLRELTALERARRDEAVGPRTYETARRALIDALARLEAQLPKVAPKSRKRRAARA